MRRITRRFGRESGQGLVEYGLIIALVSVAVILTLTVLGTQLDGLFQSIIDALPD